MQCQTLLIYYSEISLFFKIVSEYTDAHIPYWHKFKYSITVETGLLHSQWLTSSHLHSPLLWNRWPPQCCFCDPNKLSATRCDISAWQCNPTQCIWTQIIAVISLRDSGPHSLLFWPFRNTWQVTKYTIIRKCKWLPELSQMQEPIFYCDGGLKLVPRLYKCINTL